MMLLRLNTLATLWYEASYYTLLLHLAELSQLVVTPLFGMLNVWQHAILAILG